MSPEPPAFDAEIKAAAAHVRALLSLDARVASGSLLPELATLDEAEQHLRTARDTVLAEVRRRGSSWNTIEASTGVPATTWRGRHDRFIEEASQS